VGTNRGSREVRAKKQQLLVNGALLGARHHRWQRFRVPNPLFVLRSSFIIPLNHAGTNEDVMYCPSTTISVQARVVPRTGLQFC